MATQMTLTSSDHTDSIFANLSTRGWNRSTCGAVFGLVGGILAPILGSVFTAVGWISGPTWHGFAIQRIGTVLLFLTIPLLLFGAHCLDLSDRDAKRAKSGHFYGEITNDPTKEGEHHDLERN
jgi:hypothetical protein